MSYIEKNLMSGEKLMYQESLHWVIFLPTAAWILVSFVLFAQGPDIAPIGAITISIGILTAISSFINYKTSEFGVTNKRVIVKVGFIRRNSLEVLLNKVEGIQVSQGIMGRILDFGSITVSGTGGSRDPFHKISAPLEFRKQVQEQVSAV